MSRNVWLHQLAAGATIRGLMGEVRSRPVALDGQAFKKAMNLPEMGPCSVRIEEEGLWDFRLSDFTFTIPHFPKSG